ncbi:MAG: hypothetical protein JO066_08405 [Verrucomicrobia bacterium]|nr:hypothetical protein [Verrucomicrobiota bacterium]
MRPNSRIRKTKVKDEQELQGRCPGARLSSPSYSKELRPFAVDTKHEFHLRCFLFLQLVDA